MPNPSQRSLQAHSSPIRKLAAYADQAKKDGKTIWHLNIGQPDILSPEQALQAVKTADLKLLAYSPSSGTASYRGKMPRYYRKFGITVAPEDILVTNGASEAILFALLACLDAGESVLTPEPFYANYLGFAGMAGVVVKTLPTRIETGFALPSVDDFRRAITPDVRAILLCNPNNPTGTVYPEAMLRTLAEVVMERNLFLLVDEVYREFCYGETPFFSALNLPGLEKHVVVLDSISKRFSACGARVGAILTRNHELLTAIQKYAETRLSPPTYGQIFAEATLETPETYFETVKAEYQRRRDLLHRRLSAMPGVTCYLPDGAFYLFARFPVDDADRFCQWLLEAFSYQNQTVMLAPGSGFYGSPGLGTQEVRLAYVLNCDDLNCAMDCLERALEQYPGRTGIHVAGTEPVVHSLG
jgi:aspartate aminotransferase